MIFQQLELKYPSVYAALAFFCGLAGPTYWLAICLPVVLLLARRQNEYLFLWCLFPFSFGVYAQQHQYKSNQLWQQLEQDEGFLAFKLTWDQDAKHNDALNWQGWAWIDPLVDSRPVQSLRKRLWVNAQLDASLSQASQKAMLKGGSFMGWGLFDISNKFPAMKVALTNESAEHSALSSFRSALLTPLQTLTSNDQESKGFAYGLLTGNRQHLNLSVKTDFDRLGLMALLALSGLHVGIVFNLIRKLSPLGQHHHLTYAFAIFIVLAYTLLAAWPLSMVRASAMLGLYVLSLCLGRRHLAANGLIFLALYECLYDPNVLARLDFQLSYLGVFGILWALPLFPKATALKKPWWQSWLKVYWISWGAMLWTWPIVFYHFGKIPMLSWWLAPPLFAVFGTIVAYSLMLFLMMSLGIPSFEWLWKPLDWALAIFSKCSQMSAWMEPWQHANSSYTYLYYACLLSIGLLNLLKDHSQNENDQEMMFI